VYLLFTDYSLQLTFIRIKRIHPKYLLIADKGRRHKTGARSKRHLMMNGGGSRELPSVYTINCIWVLRYKYKGSNHSQKKKENIKKRYTNAQQFVS